MIYGFPQDHNKFVQKVKTTKFVVLNIAENLKTLQIFDYPILAGETRDLLSIPHVSEADIRHSLLKGDILIKLHAQEIRIVETNIDLLQFDPIHKQFLKDSGVLIGTEVGEGQLTIEVIDKLNTAVSGGMPVKFHTNMPLFGVRNSINRSFTTSDKFLNGPYLGSDYTIEINHNGRHLYPDEYSILESSPGDGFDTIVFKTFAPTQFSILLAAYVTLP